MKKNIHFHLVTTLRQGGAQRFLSRLISDENNMKHIVICMDNQKFYLNDLSSNGIHVYFLNLKIYNFIFGIFKFISLLIYFRPKIVSTWLYHADFFGGILAKIFTNSTIIWSIRGSAFIEHGVKKRTSSIIKMNALLSNYIPDAIISCSKNASKEHVLRGYSKKKIFYIPNGIDLNEWYNEKKYKENNNKNNKPIFGVIARWDKQKDFNTLFKAFKIIDNNYDWELNLIGDELDYNNLKLLQLSNSIKRNKVVLMGLRDNIKSIIQNFDFLVLSSKSEGFPNVILEAMSQGIPCIGTDVGDVKEIIQDSGWVVEKQNPKQLSESIINAIEYFKSGNNNKSKASYEIVKSKYEMDIIKKQYKSVWLSLLQK